MEKQTIKEEKAKREFALTTWALNNKNTVLLLLVILIFFGVYSYRTLPKELFPDIYIPTVMVQTLYLGNPPIDIENIITRPIEKELESVKGVKKISSNSMQDVSMIFVEFYTDVKINEALQEIREAVDKAKGEIPDDVKDSDIVISDIDFSEFPIIFINLSGDYSINELKAYAEYLEDEIESVSEISKVELSGLNEREVKINIDLHRLESYELNFNDIANAISAENMSISGGDMIIGDYRRTVRIIGEFENIKEIENVVIKNEDQDIVYLRDIGEVIYGFADPDSYARLNLQPVVTLQVVKKGGENLLGATSKIFAILDKARESKNLPEKLNITITNDQSEMVIKQLSELENNIIMGVIFVLVVLYFFLGIRNALFVGLAIPLSMLISFIVLSLLGTRINMIVLYALILALGMLVDNAVVVVENIFRFYQKGNSKFEASKRGTGEIAVPIIVSTATTLAAFFPLLFWDSLMGEFMSYIPLVLIISLSASLFVALVITPVITSSFIKSGDQNPRPKVKRAFTLMGIMIVSAVFFYVIGVNWLGSVLIIFSLVGLMNVLFLYRISKWFQEKFLPWLENNYARFIRFALKGKNPAFFIGGMFVLMIFTIIFYFARNPKVMLFPSTDPQLITVLAELPIGTDIEATSSFIAEIEKKVFDRLEPNMKIVKSVQTIIGKGAMTESEGFSGKSGGPNRGMITINFVDYEKRGGVNTADILNDFTDLFVGKYPGVLFSIEKNSDGPPTGKPINIEISGENYDALLKLTDSVQGFIDASGIQGIDGLKIDLDVGKPELLVIIDREQARRFGLSTYDIAMNIRTALFGREISDFKVGEDKYPIQLRLKDEYRYELASLMNQKITFRNQTTGKIVQVPISAVASVKYSTTYGAVLRKDLKRVITLYSNVVEGYNANEINDQIRTLLSSFQMPEGYKYEFTGEQEDQAESMAFLSRAMLIAVALILLLLVGQFNSVVKPVIIMITVLLSTIGVFGGLGTFKMDFIIIMTGIGIISLAGVVVNNGIVLVDYISLLKKRKKLEMGLAENDLLPLEESVDCVIQAGRTRLRPVLLTAITTILGLIPLAIGLNIDIISFLNTFDAKYYLGGDNVRYWGPMSWTIIFGLSFATFLTLVIVPSMYHALYLVKIKIIKLYNKM
jgi:multidrug efflux pump subunit AcrB